MTYAMRTMAAAAIVVAASAPALAQTGAPADRPLFVDISAGIGAKPSTLTTATTFTVFGEDGIAATKMAPGTSGLADLRIGYHVTPRVAIAGAFSGGQSTVAAATSASVPSPVRFASPTVVSLQVPDSRRREFGLHLQALYALPLGSAVTLTFAGGPSFVHLQQGVPNVNIAGSTPTVVSVNESGNGVGANVGADLSTFFAERYGLGMFVRYVATSIDLPSASAVKAGGLQVGGGLRLRF